MNISVREFGATRVVDLEGEVDLGTSPNLRRVLFDLLGKAQKLALNLRALRYIDSSGIATLIEVLKDARRLGKEFVLFGLNPAVQDVFRLTHVNRVFQIVDSEEQAVTSSA
jgi:anti-sigma B factor antagonist